LSDPAQVPAQVEVRLWAGLRRFTDGALVVPVQAVTVGQMLDALVAAHPGLAPAIRAGVTVAVDGVVLTDAHHRPIPPGAEVVLMQRVKGG
jgi:molybdopterin synthase sulfur carrier subunit